MNQLRNVFILTVILFIFTVFSASAREYLGHQFLDKRLIIQTDDGQLTLNAIHSQALEVVYQQDKQSSFPSFAKDASLISSHQTAVALHDNEQSLTFSTPVLTAVVNKKTAQIAFYRNGKLLLSEEMGYFNQSTVEGFRFKLQDDEKLLGSGERVLGMDRRGHRLPLYNRAHYGYTTESYQMNYGIPAIFSSNKYILLFDNSASAHLDLGKTEKDILQFETKGGRQSYIVMAGSSYPKLIESYVNVTGFQPMPPRWAFGNHSSRFGYHTQQEVLDTIATFREKDVPVDSIILDLYWFGKEITGHMGTLDWEKETFPEPNKMIQQLKEDGVNTVLISEPFITTTSKRWDDAVKRNALGKNITNKEPQIFDFFFGNTGLVDVFSEDGQQWFGNIYKDLANQGVTGVWGDLGEPEVHPDTMLHYLSEQNIVATGGEVHNAYGHKWAEVVYNALIEQQSDVRPFMIMRSGFAGSQRFGMIPWTGDVSRSWGGLKPQVELSLQMSLLGMAYTHSDLGGFAGGETFDQEMYLRWLQYGVFQPIYRPHAQEKIASEPVFHDKQTVDIARTFIKMRYALLPYNYTLAYQNSTTGMPLMRPVFFDDEANQDLIAIKDRYYWGDAFFVNPVTDPKLNSIKVNLPEGIWFDYFSGKQYQGGQIVDYPLTLATIPVFVKGGSIIPTTSDIKTTRDYDASVLNLDVYYCEQVKASARQIFEDDGKTSQSIANNAFELININSINQDEHFELTFNRELPGKGYKGMPKQRNINVVIHNWTGGVEGIAFNGKTLDNSVVEYDSVNDTLTLALNWQHQDTSLVIRK